MERRRYRLIVAMPLAQPHNKKDPLYAGQRVLNEQIGKARLGQVAMAIGP